MVRRKINTPKPRTHSTGGRKKSGSSKATCLMMSIVVLVLSGGLYAAYSHFIAH